MKTLDVALGEKSYKIHIENGLIDNTGRLLKEIYNGEKVFIVTDSNVGALYGERLCCSLSAEGYETALFTLPAGEKTKSFENLPKIYSALLSFGMTRSGLLVALGGGVIGDLAGFAASTFLRGIRYVQIPTSLLAQVDSSVGGKVAVDLPEGKNLAGSFHQPAAVYIDTGLLSTLTDEFFSDGMGEVIKYGFIKDKDLYCLLSSLSSREEIMEHIGDIIYSCCSIKARIVENDENDTGERMILNFGHTIGHGIEKLYGFSEYSHGQAVGVGMYEITVISEEQGLTKKGTADKIKKLLMKNSLPYEISYDKDALIETISVDKKNLNGVLNVILLKDIGECFIYKTTKDFFA